MHVHRQCVEDLDVHRDVALIVVVQLGGEGLDDHQLLAGVGEVVDRERVQPGRAVSDRRTLGGC